MKLDVLTVIFATTAMVANVFAAAGNIARLADNPLLWSLIATFQLGLVVWMFVLFRRAWRRIREERLRARMNVRIVRDGRELPARLFHFGKDDAGVDVWVVVEPILRLGDEVRFAVLPPMTAVVGMGEVWER